MAVPKQSSTVLIYPSKAQASIYSDDVSEQSSRILLICHAEGMHNRYKEIADSATTDNSGLTALGWQQADMLANWLMTHEKVDKLVSGEQLHSRLTAQRIGQAFGLPVTVAKNMPSHLSLQDAILAPVEATEEGLDPEIHTSIHNAVAEPYVQFHHALISTLSNLILEHRSKTIALVTSGSAIATILRHFFGAHKLQVRVGHTSLSEIMQRDGQWCLNYVNRSEHLPLPQIEPQEEQTQTVPSLDESEDFASIAKVYNRVANNLSVEDVERRVSAQLPSIEHLLKFADIPANANVLDLGSGLGIMALTVAKQGAAEVIGTDISLSMLEHAEYSRLSNRNDYARRVNFRLAPAQLMPFRNERFDVVFCRYTLNMSRAPERIIREASRVLKPGGIFILVDLVGGADPVKLATQNAIEARRNPAHAEVRAVETYHELIAAADLEVASESTVIFERRLDDWLGEMLPDPVEWTPVQEMVEAGMETDAAGLNARHEDGQIVFDQQVCYIKAVKPKPKVTD